MDGTYTPHQKVSSESELMKEFGVSRHTVRLAIGDLVTTGWLYREQGSGTFCADRSKESNNKNVGSPKKLMCQK
ncbi:GntR family transcriptional regulator [Lentibacillus populi]